MYELMIGVGAMLAFPLIAVTVYHRREGRRNRKAGVRKTQKIALPTRKDEDPGARR